MGSPLFSNGAYTIEGIAALASQDVLGSRFGIDLEFPSDLVARANGDLGRTQGVDGIRAVFARALITSPGEMFWRPSYGIGVEEFLNLPASTENVHRLQNRIRETLEEEPDVEEIEKLSTSISATGLIEVDLRVLLKGTTTDLSVRILGNT